MIHLLKEVAENEKKGLNMAYSAKAIANEFLTLAKTNDKDLTQMHIQKLVFIAHGFYMAVMDSPLIEDKIQAWKHGPVIPNLYEEFKGFGGKPITRPATNMELDDNFDIAYVVDNIEENDINAKECIKAVWNKFGNLTGPQLVSLTHQKNAPWNTVYNGEKNISIPNDIIKKYYKEVLSNGSI